MSRVYVAAIWSVAHRAWCEFVVSPDGDKVAALTRQLTAFCPVHVRTVSVASDDWSLIEAALKRLGPPPPSYSPKELELWCEERRLKDAAVHEFEDEAHPLAAVAAVGRA